MNKLVIWGASGHARVVLDTVDLLQRWNQIAFIDDSYPGTGTSLMGHPVVGTFERLPFLRESGYTDFLIAIGENGARARCFGECLANAFRPVTAIHPTAVVSLSASIGAGTVVMPRAVVNAGAVIGADCIINTGAIVEHDCVIGDHAHLSPGVVLGGGAIIGAYAHLGLNASVLPLAEIGRSAIVGAGAVVLKSAAPGETVVGVPAKRLSGGRRDMIPSFRSAL